MGAAAIDFTLDAADRDLLLARLSPAGLARYHSRGRWRVARWLALLDSYLLKVARGEIKRLLVEAPPRHGKSELISRYFPAWFKGVYPEKNVILASYEARFARSWGRKARDVLEDCGEEVFGVKPARGSKAADSWTVKPGEGAMHTAGVAGPITGKGAHLLIIDDPVKNAADANSDVKREAAWDWYTSTAYSRLEPDGAIVVLQTRWHEDDLAGRILKAAENEDSDDREPWTVLRLPAIADNDDGLDELGRVAGEPLWANRYDAKRLAQIKRAVGDYWWSALYQQRPVPKGGQILLREWFTDHVLGFDTDPADGMPIYVFGNRRVRAAACSHFWTVDTAATKGKASDYTAIGEWAATKRHELALLNLTHDKLEVPEILPMLKRLYAQAKRKPRFIGLEANGTGLAVYQLAKRDGTLPVRKLEAETDKVTRVLPFAAMAQDGKVWIPEREWRDGLLTEMAQFPRAKHDDRVDVCGYAGIVATEILGAEYGIGVVVRGAGKRRTA